MPTAIQVEANIAKNLIGLAAERGIPSAFCEADVDEILSDTEHNDMWKFNTLRRVKNSLHEVLYAPPSRG